MQGDRRLGMAGAATGYRERTAALVRAVLQHQGHIPSGVDVGAGDGWFADSMMRSGLVGQCVPVDVVRREMVVLEPVLYDGERLPFDDHSADLVYALDVVHHAKDPLALLSEMTRVSRRWLLLKDHTYTTVAGSLTLRILDEIGNRRFSIASPGNYQHRFDWFAHLRQRGFSNVTLLHPAPVHGGLLGRLTNRLQFIALFERPTER